MNTTFGAGLASVLVLSCASSRLADGSAAPLKTTLVTASLFKDVKPERTELEVDRKRNAASFFGSSYALVTARGQLTIRNFKSGDVTLAITKDLSGEVTSSSPGAKVALLAKGLRKANPHTQLSWEVPIQARGKAEVDYTYKVYVRE